MGALNQAQQQAQLDAQREAARQAAFLPQEQLDRYRNIVTGIMGGYPGQTQTTNIPNPTPLQTALGVGTTLLEYMEHLIHQYKISKFIKIMMNRTLKRPMFRMGGSSGTGITSGLDRPRQQYGQGNRTKNYLKLQILKV